MRKEILLFALLLITVSLGAQKSQNIPGDQLIAAHNYTAAVEYYKKAVQAKPDDAEYYLKLGYCYTEIPEQRDKAIEQLEKAVELSENSKKRFLHADARFTLARAYHDAHRFDDAIRVFNELIVEEEIEKFKAIEEIEYEIAKSENAKKHIDNRKEIRVDRAKGDINSDSHDHSPCLAGDVLYFTSKRKPSKNPIADYDGQYNENIFKLPLSNLSNAQQVDEPLTTEGNDAVCWISEDEALILFYRDENIWISRKEDGQYTEPEKFKAVNSRYRETDAALSRDGNTIIFASERPGGFGGLDLYVCRKEGENKWSDPVNLGNNINTPYDDNSPFIHDDGTLYFASQGHDSMGDYDIFSAVPEGDSFAKPQNLAYPTNTVYNDIYYFLSKDKSKAWFTSDRNGSKGYTDIYHINYADSSAKYLVVEADINTAGASPENVNVKLTDVESGEETYNGKLNQKGKVEQGVERGKNYYAAVETEGYFPEAFTFSAPADTSRKRELTKRNLEPVKYENVSKHYKIKYDEDKNELNNESKMFMNTLADFHKKNPDFVIDVTVPDNGNEKDMKKRTQNAVDYLKENGVPEEKISVNLINYNEKGDKALLTVMDEGTRKKAYTAPVSDGSNTADGGNADTDKVPTGDKTPDAGNLLQNGYYVIQIAAFNKERSLDNVYFSKCSSKSKIKIIKGKDGIYRYIFGSYKYQADAEENLKIIIRKGFSDAFIRPTSWYDEH